MDTKITKYSLVSTDVETRKETTEENLPLDENLSPKNNNGPRFGKRHIQIFWLSHILITLYLIRVCISVAIVAMTSTGHQNKDVPIYHWPDKSLILSAFLWGYFVPQLFAGWAVSRFGGKWFLVASLICSSISNALVPFCASHFGSHGVMVCRIVVGISQSCLYPTLNSMLGKWAPTNERSRLGSFIFAGSSLGIVLSMLLSGYLCASWYGWPTVFYTFSAVAIINACLYSYVGANSPDQHSTISQEERFYIESNLPKIMHTEKLDTPWKLIFTSLPFWALLIAECGNNWGHHTLLSQIPNYLKNVMKFNVNAVVRIIIVTALSITMDYRLRIWVFGRLAYNKKVDVDWYNQKINECNSVLGTRFSFDFNR